MFALCQALPGPGSTKLLYAINLIRSGFAIAISSFFVWRFVNLLCSVLVDLFRELLFFSVMPPFLPPVFDLY